MADFFKMNVNEALEYLFREFENDQDDNIHGATVVCSPPSEDEDSAEDSGDEEEMHRTLKLIKKSLHRRFGNINKGEAR